MAESLAELVAAARERAALTLREVAEKSGGVLSYQTVHSIEQGRTNVGTDKLYAIADVLGLSRERVMKAARRPNLPPFELPEDADLLDKRERDLVKAFVDALLRAKGER